MGTDATTPPLFPSACSAPPREKKRKSALSWSADENQFADWLISAWNITMSLVSSRAYDKRRNRFKAIQFYRRAVADQSRYREGAVFSRDMIRAGLAAYADSPVNAKVGWKSFPDFLPDAEELLDKQLKRIGYQAPPPPNPKRDAVAPLLAHLSLGQLAEHCTLAAIDLFDHIKSYKSPKRSGPFDTVNLRYYQKLQGLVARLRSLKLFDRQALARRASAAFQDFYGVRYDPNMLIRRNRRHALALALLDLDQNRDRQRAKKGHDSQDGQDSNPVNPVPSSSSASQCLCGKDSEGLPP